MGVSINILSVLIICLLLTFIVAFFVARDANKRNMNPLVWALVAALTPFFIGLIIYLICRNPLVDLQCAKCGANISQYDKVCPSCGNVILTQCPNCDFPIQKGWNACPSCGMEFPKEYGQPVRNYKKDNGIMVVIIVVVLAVLALFVSVFSLWSLNRTRYEEIVGCGGFEGMYNISEKDMEENQAITDWLKACKDSRKKVYILASDSSDTVIIYIPNSENLMECDGSIAYVNGTEKGVISFYIENTEYKDDYGYDFFLFECKSELSQDTLGEVYMDGRDCSAEVTLTDADISWETWRDGNETE